MNSPHSLLSGADRSAFGDTTPTGPINPDPDAPFDVDREAIRLLECVPLNVMFADIDFVIRYVNPKSNQTLRQIEALLPIRAEQVLGSSIDVFHKNPAHQRQLLADRMRLPHHSVFPLGDQWVELEASAITDIKGDLVGYMVTWDVITGRRNAADSVQSHTNTVAIAIEELRNSITEISREVNEVAVRSDRARVEAQASIDALHGLIQQSNDIQGALGLIAEVASQTNLLALNATIEAARAGESGKGFAVVAAEVKQLAGAAGEAAEKITHRVQSVQNSIDHIEANIRDLVVAIEDNTGSITSIAGAMEQQSTATSSIAQAAGEVSTEINRFIN